MERSLLNRGSGTTLFSLIVRLIFRRRNSVAFASLPDGFAGEAGNFTALQTSHIPTPARSYLLRVTEGLPCAAFEQRHGLFRGTAKPPVDFDAVLSLETALQPRASDRPFLPLSFEIVSTNYAGQECLIQLSLISKNPHSFTIFRPACLNANGEQVFNS